MRLLRPAPMTLGLLVICALAASGAAAIGIDDNPPGILLGYLSAAALVLSWAHRWRSERLFVRLAWGSLLALVVVIGIVATLGFGAHRWVEARPLVRVVERLLSAPFLAAVFLCPAAFVVGVIGGTILVVRGRRSTPP